jgi:XapX domain-containing protein
MNYLLSLGVGLAVGIFYGSLGVRSPAPPVIALLGLLGMLAGEQVAPIAKRLWTGERLTLALLRQDCAAHIFGTLPGRTGTDQETPACSPAEPPRS